MINYGKINLLQITRKSDLGYMLKNDGGEDILLHYKESLKEHAVSEWVNVFIYFDKKRRPTATEKKPFITLDDKALLEVKDINPLVGVFLDINTPKDVLLSKDDLPINQKMWPQIGDKILGKLKLKNDSLIIKKLTKNEIVELNKNINYEEGEKIKAYILNINEKGILLSSIDLMAIFIPTIETRGTYRIGEEVIVTITKNMNSWYYASLIEQKELMIDSDKELILNYLKIHKYMTLTSKSSAEEIFKCFKISRKAFKRAYGGLYKDKLITFDENKTWLL